MPQGDGRKEGVSGTCAACGKEYVCPPNQAPRRECCTPPHNGGRDNCCNCKLRKIAETGGKIEFMSTPEVSLFLRTAKKIGVEYYLAFRLSINGMLKPCDLERLKVSDLKLYRDENDPGKPCLLKVDKVSVELDCETLAAVQEWCGGKTGRIFPFRRHTLRRAFRKVLKVGNICPDYQYTLHSLRHTGIMLRVRCAKNLTDLEAIRKDARLHSLLSLKPYLSKESTSLLENVRFVK